MNSKLIIGGLVGGILLFIWSFLSWGILPLHKGQMKYTAAQDEILQLLSAKLTEEGTYFLPTVPDGTSNEEAQKSMEAQAGKPWASISYHKSMSTAMGMNMARGLLVNIVVCMGLLWLIYKQKEISFSSAMTFSLVFGVLAYLSTTYTNSIWFENDTLPDLIDAIVGWGLVGLWFGWWAQR